MQNFFISKRFQNSYFYFCSVFLIIYIAIDLPKLYLFSILLFPLYFYFSKVKINYLDIYLIPCVFLCFYIEPSLYAFKFSINILAQSVWAVTAFVTGTIIFNEIMSKRLNFKNIIFLVFIGSLIHLLIIIFFSIFIFDFPITRNGFVHPFTKVNGEFLIFNLENLKYVNPINIRSLYVVLEIILTSSILLSILSKKRSLMYFLINIIIFIIGCSFGSRLFVIYFFIITLLLLILNPQIRKTQIIFFIINLFIFFNNITIYDFIDKQTYIKVFNQNLQNFKKSKSYQIQFNDINQFLLTRKNYELKWHKIYLEDNYLLFNNHDNVSFVIKSTPDRLDYLKKERITYISSKYKNTFTINYDSWRTSYERYFDKYEKKNLFNRLKIIGAGMSHFNEFLKVEKVKIKNKLNNIITTDEVIFHNFLLDSFNRKSYLGGILMLFIYFKLIKFIFNFYRNENFNLVLIILSYFLYDQFIQTSILTSKNSIFLFNIIFLLSCSLTYMNKKEVKYFFERSNF